MNCAGCGKPMSHRAKHGRCWDCYVDSMRAPKGKPKRVYCEPFGWMRLPEGVTVRYVRQKAATEAATEAATVE